MIQLIEVSPGRYKEKEVAAFSGDCLHLGNATGRTVPCGTCKGGRSKLKTFNCLAGHGDCTTDPTRPAVGATCCGPTCRDYAPTGRKPPVQELTPRQKIQIHLPGHFNCSIIERHGQMLLASRLGWHGRIFLSKLNANCQPVWTRDLKLAHVNAKSGVEDPRLFVHQNQLHLAFTGYEKHTQPERTSQLLCRLSDKFEVEKTWMPIYDKRNPWEKNWQFFSHKNELYSVYQIQPHTILRHQDDFAGLAYETNSMISMPGKTLRGGCPPVLVGTEYYHWYHAVYKDGRYAKYGFGLYTFEDRPPFAMRRKSDAVLFTTVDRLEGWNKLVVFPCGALIHNRQWVISYGWQDRECRIVHFDFDEVEGRLR